jgi:hypothetical protein
MKKIYILTIFLVTLLVSTNVEACSISSDWSFEPEFHLDRSDVVFIGTISETEKVGGINGNFVITFDVEKLYKGTVGSSVAITTGANSAMCGYDDINIFSKGDVWGIYASDDLYTTSITANTKYDSVKSAIDKLDKSLIKDSVFCPLNYDPVCGRKDTGVRCITTPCDSTEDITYGNSCALGVDKAEFLYDGECKSNDTNDVIEEDYDIEILDMNYVEVKENPEEASFWSKFFKLISEVLSFKF